ncbi:hydroxymethylglutaryl-CoA reductase, degradative [Desemzia sp. RIT804]|uniref:hydroxymethylglutaryl-CoA reductase, degradative n=1 Tax=Desemzia sp. RIT 804 TaxID=2810209 RepID=UPI00194FB4AD|nr:hydroxymethylglutaryl-CoA reductase, degradative [Desemzia sp. RIT 804]MBM6615561.1 hydroxymethylglutaryl-CoA reductase, degradative [Desemzia sp. RIT 804]
MDYSYLNRFYTKNRIERIQALLDADVLTADKKSQLELGMHLSKDAANNMIENQLATYELPYGAALNFLINGKDYVVPMAIEEPSVIAAASSAAKTIKQAGGFTATTTDRIMIGQVALKNPPHAAETLQLLTDKEAEIIQTANQAHPSIVKRGGGAVKLEVRHIKTDELENTPEFIVLHLHIKTLEAMGANIINTMMEGIIPYVEELTQSKALMGILSNYATECLATATCRIPVEHLQKGAFSGEEVRDRIIDAYQFAYVDPYRAVTHNKGIMNGIDGIIIASGNDWRAISAGIHAYASKSGQYRSLSQWKKAENGDLLGSLTLPLPIGTVGGSISFHPAAKMTKAILHYENAAELESIIVSVGLAQNLAAIKALVTEGIQKGHMGLQSRSLAISAGAKSEEIDWLSRKLKQAENMNLATAEKLLEEYRQ